MSFPFVRNDESLHTNRPSFHPTHVLPFVKHYSLVSFPFFLSSRYTSLFSAHLCGWLCLKIKSSTTKQTNKQNKLAQRTNEQTDNFPQRRKLLSSPKDENFAHFVNCYIKRGNPKKIITYNETYHSLLNKSVTFNFFVYLNFF